MYLNKPSRMLKRMRIVFYFIILSCVIHVSEERSGAIERLYCKRPMLKVCGLPVAEFIAC